VVRNTILGMLAIPFAIALLCRFLGGLLVEEIVGANYSVV
jgi:hypothetical protein